MQAVDRLDPYNACVASSSGLTPEQKSGRQMPLERIVVGRWYGHLDLVSNERRGGGPDSACVLLKGRFIAPPALRPSDKGKGVLASLSGEGDFKWWPEGSRVYRLGIERDSGVWDTYYCHLGRPPDSYGWFPSYRTMSEAWGMVTRMRNREDEVSELRQLPRATVNLAQAPLAAGLMLADSGDDAGADTSPRPTPPSSPPPSVPRSRRAHALMYPVFTPELIEKTLKDLQEKLAPEGALLWAAWAGRDLLAVTRTPRSDWTRHFFDKARKFDYRVEHYDGKYHSVVSFRSRLLGGGTMPPMHPGESATVEAYDDGNTWQEWVLELCVDARGKAQTVANERPFLTWSLPRQCSDPQVSQSSQPRLPG